MELEKARASPRRPALGQRRWPTAAATTCTVRGAALDARGILQGVRAGAIGGSADIFPIAISLDVEVVTGQNDVALSNVAGKLTITRKGLDAASLKGKANEQPGLRMDARPRRRHARAPPLRRRRRRADPLLPASTAASPAATSSSTTAGRSAAAGAGVAVMRDFRLLNETALKPAINTVTSNAARGGVDRQAPRQTERAAVQPAQDSVPPGGLGDHDRRCGAARRVDRRDRQRHHQHAGRQDGDQRRVHSGLRPQQRARRDPAARRACSAAATRASSASPTGCSARSTARSSR